MNGSTLEYRFASVSPTAWTKLYTFTGSDGDGADGADGFSPVITVKEDTETSYVLEIETASDKFETPNLKGGDCDGLGGGMPYTLVRLTEPTTINLNDEQYLQNGDWAFSFENSEIVLENFPAGWAAPTATGTGSVFLSVRTHYLDSACHQNLRMSSSWTTWTRYVNSERTTFSVWRTGGAAADIDNYVSTTAGTTTALTANFPGWSETAGRSVRLRLASAIGDNATLSINGGTARQIRLMNNTQIQSGTVASGAVITLVYYNNYFFLQGGNPPEVTVTFNNFTMPYTDFSVQGMADMASGEGDAIAITDATTGNIWYSVRDNAGVQTRVRTINATTNVVTERTGLGFNMNNARSVGQMGNGDIWFFAGSQTTSNVVKYTPSGTQTVQTSLTTPRLEPGVARNNTSGDLFVVGGRNNLGNGVTEVSSYGTSGTETVRAVLPTNNGMYNPAACTGISGNAWFLGGYSTSGNRTPRTGVHIFSSTGTRTTGTALTIGRGMFSAAVNGAGAVIANGGIQDYTGGSVDSPNPTAVTEKYTASTTQTVLSPLSRARGDMTAILDTMGRIWSAGGRGTPYLEQINVIDIRMPDDSLMIRQITNGRAGAGGAIDGLGNIWYIGGRFAGYSGPTNTIEKWSGKTTIPAPNGTKYSFNGQVEQTLNGVLINAPMKINTGYIKYKSGVISN